MPPIAECRTKFLVDFAATVEGREVVTLAVGPHNEVLLLSLAGAADYRRGRAGGATFARLFGRRTNRFRIDCYRDGEWVAVDLPPTRENYHDVQPLPDGWLVVRGRAESETDRNAHVFAADGAPRFSFHAGDGIQHVQATPGGEVWAGFFDEGVFGNLLLGRAGLVRFDPAGTPTFRFNDVIAGKYPDIADCYALNAAGDGDVWTSYYTDFPLVRVRNGRVAEHYTAPVSGCVAFAVAAGRALFADGPDLTLFDFATGASQSLRPTDESGERLDNTTALARGGRLTLIRGSKVSFVDLINLGPIPSPPPCR